MDRAAADDILGRIAATIERMENRLTAQVGSLNARVEEPTAEVAAARGDTNALGRVVEAEVWTAEVFDEERDGMVIPCRRPLRRVVDEILGRLKDK